MNIYSQMASEYDKLFPHPAGKTQFVEEFLSEKDTNILDLGCATGELLLTLRNKKRKLIGIDLDGEMVRRAQEKACKIPEKELQFLLYDMVSYVKYISPASQDVLICFGNTLAYIYDPDSLKSFLTDCYGLLKQGGHMMIQLLNYDNPDMGVNCSFTELHTENVTFTRSYTAAPEGHLDFNTELTLKPSQEKYSDTHRLYPFHSDEITALSYTAGFKECLIFGGYDRREANLKDVSRLFVLKKA